MRIPALLLAAGTLALAGCATPDKDMHTKALCSSSPCSVTVTVTDCRNIRTNPYRLEIPPGNTSDIEWRLVAPPGWTFTRDGIAFKHGHGAGFSPGGGSGDRFRYHNNHSKLGPHDYDVNVTPDRGTTRCTQDPTIVNH